MTVPEAENSAVVVPAAPWVGTRRRTVAVEPRASDICEAIVRFQMSS